MVFFVGCRVSLNEGPGEIRPAEPMDYFEPLGWKRKILHFPHLVHLGTLYGSQNKQRILPCTALTFRHRASCILGQAFHYSPENGFYIFNQQIYFII